MYGNELPTISKVSQLSSASSEGLVPSRPIAPVVYGLSSGKAALPNSALITGVPSFSAMCSNSSVPRNAPLPSQHGDLPCAVQNLRRCTQVGSA